MNIPLKLDDDLKNSNVIFPENVGVFMNGLYVGIANNYKDGFVNINFLSGKIFNIADVDKYELAIGGRILSRKDNEIENFRIESLSLMPKQEFVKQIFDEQRDKLIEVQKFISDKLEK